MLKFKAEHQNGEERGFKGLWTWNGCWCQTGWSEYFKNCWSTGIFTHNKEFGIKNMKASCLVSTVQAGGGGVMVWGIFSWHILGPLVPIEHRLNTTAYLSIVADHVHPFMTTVNPSSDVYFQQDNAPCHKAQIISDWFLEHDNEFTLLKLPPVTRSQSNRAPLGCGGTGDSHHGCAADKSAATVWCYHDNMDNLWGMFLTPCWIYAMKN